VDLGEFIKVYQPPKHFMKDSVFLLEVTHFGYTYCFHIPRKMTPQKILDLLVGHGFLRESLASKVNVEELEFVYWSHNGQDENE
jgi:hypothetical protein